MKTVNFTEMKNGTKEDYELLEKFEKNFERQTAERVLNYLSKQTTTLEGYKITRLEHSLQAATRAFKNKESDEMVVATLLHLSLIHISEPTRRSTIAYAVFCL